MRSLSSRLLALWLMLAASAVVTGFLLFQFYRQSANAQVSQAEDAVTRACRDIGDRYSFFLAGWKGASQESIDDDTKRGLTDVLRAALARATGIEGGIWQARFGSLAYAFPTYEGSGPKTDLPIAELSTIRQINAESLRAERPVTVRQTGQSQVLVVHACLLTGPITEATAWTMARVYIGQGPAYNQLLAGLAVLSLSVLGSALWLGRVLLSWSRNIGRLELELVGRHASGEEMPVLQPTGERELDRLVEALNASRARLGEARLRTAAAERLAAIGRLAASVAHEIRNPIAAMRLKAENALAGADDVRRTAALRSILDQISRLDGLLRDLLMITQRRSLNPTEVDLNSILLDAVDSQREVAKAKGIDLTMVSLACGTERPVFDADQVRRALDNLILNAIQNTPAGGHIKVEVSRNDSKLHLRVIDTGTGVPGEIRDRLFEPFVTARADGTGLGLAIVREISRAHGGDARLLPSPQGAAFEIELPWRPS